MNPILKPKAMNAANAKTKITVAVTSRAFRLKPGTSEILFRAAFKSPTHVAAMRHCRDRGVGTSISSKLRGGLLSADTSIAKPENVLKRYHFSVVEYFASIAAMYCTIVTWLCITPMPKASAKGDCLTTLLTVALPGAAIDGFLWRRGQSCLVLFV